jgi:hypothetical protein
MTDAPIRQPIGPLVDSSPGKRPERVTLKGRQITLAPLEADALIEGANGGEKDRVWTYLLPLCGPGRLQGEHRRQGPIGGPAVRTDVNNDEFRGASHGPGG